MSRLCRKAEMRDTSVLVWRLECLEEKGAVFSSLGKSRLFPVPLTSLSDPVREINYWELLAKHLRLHSCRRQTPVLQGPFCPSGATSQNSGADLWLAKVTGTRACPSRGPLSPRPHSLSLSQHQAIIGIFRIWQ